jgi:acyl-CoA reductase-like NAD-dependent aldehyde dehydrogenase
MAFARRRARLAALADLWQSLSLNQRSALLNAIEDRLDDGVGPLIRLALFRLGLIDRQSVLTKQGQYLQWFYQDAPVTPDPPP